MNTRIKQLRKTLSLTQSDFGAKIGLTGAAITRIEKGNNNPSEQTVLSICREFNVNEEWLRTGNGDIFEQLTESEKLMKYTALLLKDSKSTTSNVIKNIIITYEQLDDTSKEVLDKIINKYIHNMKRGIMDQNEL